jgi:hypothetical protein
MVDQASSPAPASLRGRLGDFIRGTQTQDEATHNNVERELLHARAAVEGSNKLGAARSLT